MDPDRYETGEAREFSVVVSMLRDGRDEILRDWIGRVRDHHAIQAGEALSDPLLLDHLPQLFDAILERLGTNRSREEAEQFATVHGFARRITGYDVLETVTELLMFRHAIWTHLSTMDAPSTGSFALMEQIDGMVDRAVISSLRAFLDPGAKMLMRREDGDGEGGEIFLRGTFEVSASAPASDEGSSASPLA
jgi:hypothetical protein